MNSLTGNCLSDILTIVLGLLIFVYWYMTKNFNYWKNKKVQFIKPKLIFGNFYETLMMKYSIGEYFEKIYNTCTNQVIGLFVFNKPCLLIKDPDLVKHVLIKDFQYFSERTVAASENDKLGTSNLFTIKNPQWRQMRIKLTPTFSSGKIKGMFPLMKTVGDGMKEYIRRFDVDDMHETKEICAKYSTDVIASCAYGIQANSFTDENAEFRNIGRRIFKYSFRRALEFMSFFFTPALVDLFGFYFFEPSCTPFLRNVFWEVINEREKSKVKRQDLIDTLIKLKNSGTDEGNESNNDKNEKNPVDKHEDNAKEIINKMQVPKGPELKFEGDTLVAQAAVFFTAGFETTSTTISMTLYELCLNQDLQNRLRKEILTVLKEHNNEVSYEAMMEMKFLDQCVSETLRKYPTLPFLDRLCQNNYQLPGTNLIIEKGTPVYISLFGLQRDPKYFPDPLRYDPDRFSDENKSKLHPCVYMPFGEGPHNCIGKRFGLMSTKVGLINILSEFEVHRCSKTPVPFTLDPRAILISSEKDLYMTFKRCSTMTS